MSELWHGFKKEEFVFEGKKAILVFPVSPDQEKNWALKTEYWDAFPETEIELLKRGFHVAYLENISRFATKEDCDAKARFAEYLKENYGLCDKCVPVGMSCGGAHAVNFAGFYPDKVACMFIDAPVLNFCSFPGRLDNQDCEYIWNNEFVKAYPGITRAKLLGFDNHPIGKVDILKNKAIPIIMLYGTIDTVVDYNENGRLLEMEYSDMGDLFKVIPRSEQGHHPHGIPQNPEIIADFIVKNTQK